jgi:hypothetical protein
MMMLDTVNPDVNYFTQDYDYPTTDDLEISHDSENKVVDDSE